MRYSVFLDGKVTNYKAPNSFQIHGVNIILAEITVECLHGTKRVSQSSAKKDKFILSGIRR